MDRNEITRIAREAGFVGMDGDHGALRRFANLVAAAEREACAKLVEDYLSVGLAKEMSRIIRERGNHAAG